MQNCISKNLRITVQPPKMQKFSKVGQKPYRYELMNGQKFLTLPKIVDKRVFQHFIIDFGVTSLQVPSSPDYLTLCETKDIEISIAEIQEGKAKKFKSVEAFLKELKE
jgi:hypothetical protein